MSSLSLPGCRTIATYGDCGGGLKSDVKCYCMGFKMVKYRGADKSLARPGKKQALPVESVMSRGVD